MNNNRNQIERNRGNNMETSGPFEGNIGCSVKTMEHHMQKIMENQMQHESDGDM